jgi:hypothetical protein
MPAATSAPSDNDVEVVKLRGRDIVSGTRLVVWYEQESGKVEYNGTVTRLSATQGVRVWFDGHSFTEQEWVNGEDEWCIEDEDRRLLATVAPSAPADAVAAEDEEARCEFQRVKLKLGKLSQMLPKSSKTKRKRTTDATDADPAAADADAAAGSATPAAPLGPDTVYHINANGVFASERAGALSTNLPALKAPRRAPPSFLAKYGRCELSGGAVAIYRDPLTGARFGSAAAFRALRAAHAQQQEVAAASEDGGAAAAAVGVARAAARVGGRSGAR